MYNIYNVDTKSTEFICDKNHDGFMKDWKNEVYDEWTTNDTE